MIRKSDSDELGVTQTWAGNIIPEQKLTMANQSCISNGKET